MYHLVKNITSYYHNLLFHLPLTISPLYIHFYISFFPLYLHNLTNRFDGKTNLLGMSYAQFPPDQLGPGGDLFLKVVHMFGLAKVEWGVGDSGKDVRVNNLTLINFVLKFVGPTHEQTLTIYMMIIQVCAYVCV